MSKWTDIKAERLQDVRYCQCMCGCKYDFWLSGNYAEGNHVFIGQRKAFPELNAIENMQLVCHACHNPHSHNRETKLYFANITEFNTLEWLHSLPDKLKRGDRWKEVVRIFDENY